MLAGWRLVAFLAAAWLGRHVRIGIPTEINSVSTQVLQKSQHLILSIFGNLQVRYRCEALGPIPAQVRLILTRDGVCSGGFGLCVIGSGAECGEWRSAAMR